MASTPTSSEPYRREHTTTEGSLSRTACPGDRSRSRTAMSGGVSQHRGVVGSQDAFLREGAARGETVLPYAPTRVGRMLEPFG
ncbi:hypothetical protein ABZ348_00005, partial [Streptomyces sp. NPDC005963]|uniref:hypothetical protein n=1 Tax=Streptomyces sp. NPDC005963 TaxID=3156721 RepID=UPI0033C8BE0E